MFWVKWDHQNRCRRFPVATYDDIMTTFRSFESKIRQIVPEFDGKLAWKDGDGDLIPLLSAVDLHDALSQPHNKNLLRIYTIEDVAKNESGKRKLIEDNENAISKSKTQSVTIKWDHHGQCRLLKISLDSSYRELIALFKSRVPDFDEILCWKDNEGDLVVISSDDELSQALRYHSPDQYLRFTTFVNQSLNSSGRQRSDYTKYEKSELYKCTNCNGNFGGLRYDCTICEDTHFCSKCEKQGVHDNHPLVRLAASNVLMYEGLFNTLRSHIKDYTEFYPYFNAIKRRISWYHLESCYHFVFHVEDGFSELVNQMKMHVPDFSETVQWQDGNGDWHTITDNESLKFAFSAQSNLYVLRLHTSPSTASTVPSVVSVKTVHNSEFPTNDIMQFKIRQVKAKLKSKKSAKILRKVLKDQAKSPLIDQNFEKRKQLLAEALFRKMQLSSDQKNNGSNNINITPNDAKADPLDAVTSVELNSSSTADAEISQISDQESALTKDFDCLSDAAKSFGEVECQSVDSTDEWYLIK